MHIVFIIANNSSVPYFNWFARKSIENPELKFSFIALCEEYPKMLDEMKEKNCDCHWFKFNSAKRKTSTIKVLFKLVPFLKKTKPDIVHTHLFDDSFPGLLAARIAGVKVRIATKQDAAYHWFYSPKAIKFDKFNNQNATHLIAVSEECKKFILENEKAPAEKVHLIHHGIEPGELTNPSPEHKETLIKRFDLKDKIVLGTVARYIDWKGYKYIIEAACDVVKEFPNAVFLFIGSGPQGEELEKMVKEKKLINNVIFTGWLERELVPSIYSIMDLYVHAAFYEPFGFVIAEAMMNAVPVISTPTGAAKDAITHLHNGYLVPYKNSKELSRGIITMLLNENKKQIGLNGKQTALKMYDFSLMYSKYVSLYEKAANQK
ncbi:MAG: glycosyltransferase family 4 protein [Bacteroidota bacterium]|nr:glycosyltransferase family 4 protein [Bacteroidota bacterium]